MLPIRVKPWQLFLGSSLDAWRAGDACVARCVSSDFLLRFLVAPPSGGTVVSSPFILVPAWQALQST